MPKLPVAMKDTALTCAMTISPSRSPSQINDRWEWFAQPDISRELAATLSSRQSTPHLQVVAVTSDRVPPRCRAGRRLPDQQRRGRRGTQLSVTVMQRGFGKGHAAPHGNYPPFATDHATVFFMSPVVVSWPD